MEAPKFSSPALSPGLFFAAISTDNARGLRPRANHGALSAGLMLVALILYVVVGVFFLGLAI